MLQSELFTKVERNAPKDEVALSAKLLERAGFVSKVMAGVYEFMPLGLRVLNKINAIIRDEMDKTGAQEIFMSVLQSKETWSRSGRWETARDVMYQFKDAGGREVGLGWTHEEPITVVAKKYISSYRDLPKAVYQIQTKFRNELRAKSGLLRSREFLMKDLYSFHASEESLNEYYERVAAAYQNIFKRVGLNSLRTVASGGLFSKFSDEFQVLCPAGEDMVFYCERCFYAANREVAKELGLKSKCPRCQGVIKKGKSIEVGNIFKLGTKFSEAFGLMYRDKNGAEKPVIMASYGIGPGRLMATIVEIHHDKDGIIWPESVTPFKVHLLGLNNADGREFYGHLQKAKIDVLYDDRETSAGEKLVGADLIGIPWRIVLNPKLGDKVEIKRRGGKKVEIIKQSQALRILLEK
jgi:prolyl-tRNA synthetase